MQNKRNPVWRIAIIWVVLLVWNTQPALAGALIVYFSATPQDGQVLLEWETASEISIDGFYINRSLTQNGDYTRVSTLILDEGGSQAGAIYQFYDTGVTNGVVYWYLLEVVNQDQSTEYFTPAISVMPISQTRTVTPTGTITVVATSTGSGTPTITATATRTLTPTATLALSSMPDTPIATTLPSYPEPDTQASASALNETVLSNGLEATATLIPLPEISMIFPTQARDLTGDVRSGIGENAQSLNSVKDRQTTIVRSIIYMGVIIFVWAILVGGYFFSTRRINKFDE